MSVSSLIKQFFWSQMGNSSGSTLKHKLTQENENT